MPNAYYSLIHKNIRVRIFIGYTEEKIKKKKQNQQHTLTNLPLSNNIYWVGKIVTNEISSLEYWAKRKRISGVCPSDDNSTKKLFSHSLVNLCFIWLLFLWLLHRFTLLGLHFHLCKSMSFITTKYLWLVLVEDMKIARRNDTKTPISLWNQSGAGIAKCVRRMYKCVRRHHRNHIELYTIKCWNREHETMNGWKNKYKLPLPPNHHTVSSTKTQQ